MFRSQEFRSRLVLAAVLVGAGCAAAITPQRAVPTSEIERRGLDCGELVAMSAKVKRAFLAPLAPG